ncbi:MAG TPA: hypothetical protein VFM93_11675 [Candidatus Limnocylindria bacterium]|nr:hypothetical protein [Candidatus Limnocylindria bacterium]
MRKRQQMVGVILALTIGSLAATAGAQEFDPHPHMLVVGVEFNEAGAPIGYQTCVDLAAGQALPVNTQHEHLHFGTAGQYLAAKADSYVVPGAPFPAPFGTPLPWSNCEELIAFFFGQ